MPANTSTEDWKIVQLLPAQPGWHAVYAWGTNVAKVLGVNFCTRPLIAWALVEDGATSFVVALQIVDTQPECEPSAKPVFVLGQDGFLGYTYPGDETDWNSLAQEYQKNYWDSQEQTWANGRLL